MATTTQAKSVRATYAVEFGNVATSVESLAQVMRAAATQEAGARMKILDELVSASVTLAEMACTLADAAGEELNAHERSEYRACNIVPGRPQSGGAEVIDMNTRARYQTIVFGEGLNGGDAA